MNAFVAHAGLALLTLAALSGNAVADETAAELARSKNCFSCHDLTHAGFGPSFQEVARRYRHLENADLMLADEIKDGTNQHWALNKQWGSNPMPPSVVRASTPVSEAEAKMLAQWVLQQP